MTFCFSILDTADGKLTFSSAGHPFPYHYCAATQRLMPWEMKGELPLGVRQDCDVPILSRILARNDALIYYSDGLVEGTNSDSELFGFEKLEAAIIQNGHRAASEMKQAILTEFGEHCRGHEQEDDVTLIVIKLNGT